MIGNSQVQSLPDTKYNTHRRLPVFTHGRCLEIVDQFSIATYALGIKIKQKKKKRDVVLCTKKTPKHCTSFYLQPTG